MYLGYQFYRCLYDFSIRFRNCSDSMVFFTFYFIKLPASVLLKKLFMYWILLKCHLTTSQVKSGLFFGAPSLFRLFVNELYNNIQITKKCFVLCTCLSVVVCVIISLVFRLVFCRSLYMALSFFRLANVLPVFRCTTSDYPFGLFKPFLKLFPSLYW
jgi:hypothetical protein